MLILVLKGQHKYYSFIRNLQQSSPSPKLKAVGQNIAYLPLTATNKFSFAHA